MTQIKSLLGLTVQKSMLLMITATCIIGCGRKNETEKTSKIIPVKVVHVEFSDENITQNYVGTAEGIFAISLSFSGSGNIERVMVSEGQKVSKGQLLAVMNSVTIQNAYEVSVSTLKQAQDAYDRLSELHKKGSLPDIKFIEVETGLEKAKAMEAISRKNLEDCKLYAPVFGVIAKRSIEEGQTAMPGIPAFKIVDINDVDINVSIPENEIGNIEIGQQAIVQITALNNKEYSGKVDIKGVEANPISHTYKIKIRLKNPQLEIMPGMVCKVLLKLPDTGNNKKIIIPNKSVQISSEGKRFVWLSEGNMAIRRFITTGKLTDYGVVVETGLKEGEQLIVEGCNKISEGMQVSITK
jgi:RND family efflux transporter MFP subunit